MDENFLHMRIHCVIKDLQDGCGVSVCVGSPALLVGNGPLAFKRKLEHYVPDGSDNRNSAGQLNKLRNSELGALGVAPFAWPCGSSCHPHVPRLCFPPRDSQQFGGTWPL